MTRTTAAGDRLPPAGRVFLLYFVLTLALTFPLILHLDAAIPGDGFDGWQNYWNFWWLRQSLVEPLRIRLSRICCTIPPASASISTPTRSTAL
ncbi:hypothetical protein [Candidatus Amarolinea dominans]|uniref:hypothetical protein n=1 Tax=Candidatus Amarolinea dominans TaxID=3140696 RepID=UPI003135925E|nr:hypothetical protein [Anaerolineae bacterium]